LKAQKIARNSRKSGGKKRKTLREAEEVDRQQQSDIDRKQRHSALRRAQKLGRNEGRGTVLGESAWEGAQAFGKGERKSEGPPRSKRVWQGNSEQSRVSINQMEGGQGSRLRGTAPIVHGISETKTCFGKTAWSRKRGNSREKGAIKRGERTGQP